MSNGMIWTDERVELLKRLWADGLSARQIAAELGGWSRSAIIGKVHRLGLSGRAKPPCSTAPRPRKARAHPMRVAPSAIAWRHRSLAQAFVEYEVEAEPELVDNIIPIGQRCNLLELTRETCRWPVGDPGSADFFFCGGQTMTALPYCSHHSRIAYQPSADRRHDRRSFQDKEPKAA
jgi:GcrA cell cycle regulator